MFFRQKSTLLSDTELISQFKKSGELTFLSELFGRYTSMVYGVCLKYLKDRDEAKDGVMQLFEKLPASLKAHQIANFKGWIYVTARNHCLMQIRSKKVIQTHNLELNIVENEPMLHLEEESHLEGDLDKLERCIDRLADEQKQCVRLFFLEERCYKEISMLTAFDVNKVKSYIQNGKRNLKICMETNE